MVDVSSIYLHLCSILQYTESRNVHTPVKNKLANYSQCLSHFLLSLTEGRVKTLRRFWYGQKSLGLFFFPSTVKLLFIWNASRLFLVVFQCRLPPTLMVLSMQRVHIILKVKTTQSQARNINPLTPQPCTPFPTLGGNQPQYLCFGLPVFLFLQK